MKTNIEIFDQFSWIYDYIDVDVNVQNRVFRKSIVFDSPMRPNQTKDARFPLYYWSFAHWVPISAPLACLSKVPFWLNALTLTIRQEINGCHVQFPSDNKIWHFDWILPWASRALRHVQTIDQVLEWQDIHPQCWSNTNLFTFLVVGFSIHWQRGRRRPTQRNSWNWGISSCNQ